MNWNYQIKHCYVLKKHMQTSLCAHVNVGSVSVSVCTVHHVSTYISRGQINQVPKSITFWKQNVLKAIQNDKVIKKKFGSLLCIYSVSNSPNQLNKRPLASFLKTKKQQNINDKNITKVT